MANLGSDNTPIEGESFGLPSGYAVDEENGDLVIRDTDGTVVMRRADGAAWQLEGSDISGVGAFDSESINTGKADITSETFVKANRNTTATDVTAGTFTNIANNEVADNLDEFNSSFQFVPSESGWYDIRGQARVQSNDNDTITIRIRNVTDSVTLKRRDEVPGDDQELSITGLMELTSGKSHEVQVTNVDSSHNVSGAPDRAQLEIKRSVVHP